MKPLIVSAGGMCCALGFQREAAFWAMQANMDHFQQSDFVDRQNSRLRVAALPGSLNGSRRLQSWLEYALLDCARQSTDPHTLFDAAQTAVLVLCPEAWRGYGDTSLFVDISLDALARVGSEFGAAAEHNTTLMPAGRAGLGHVLQKARELLQREYRQVLLLGVDSYLNAGDIGHFLREERLLTTYNSNGFIPGEAAACVLLRNTGPGLLIGGAATALAAGRPDGSVPSRGRALSQAVRAACAQAGLAPAALEFRLSDQNGEQFFGREASHAFARVMAGGKQLPHLTIADKLGETGAACGVLMLAWMHKLLMLPALRPGTQGILHLANDHGLRCAVVIAQTQG